MVYSVGISKAINGQGGVKGEVRRSEAKGFGSHGPTGSKGDKVVQDECGPKGDKGIQGDNVPSVLK